VQKTNKPCLHYNGTLGSCMSLHHRPPCCSSDVHKLQFILLVVLHVACFLKHFWSIFNRTGFTPKATCCGVSPVVFWVPARHQCYCHYIAMHDSALLSCFVCNCLWHSYLCFMVGELGDVAKHRFIILLKPSSHCFLQIFLICNASITSDQSTIWDVYENIHAFE